MKFKIETSGSFYDKDQKEKLEKLGFGFRPPDGSDLLSFSTEWYKEYNEEIYIEISTIDELWSFHKKWGDLVITETYSTGIPCIEIYDDYRE